MAGKPRGDRLAEELHRRGLAAPARLLLEAHRPFRPFLAEMAAFLSPVSRPLLGTRTDPLAGLLEDDRRYDDLLQALDDAEHR